VQLTLLNVVGKTPLPGPEPGDPGEEDPQEKAGKKEDGTSASGAPHVLVVATPDGRLTFLQALASRRKGSAAAGIPAAFGGYLMTDGYTGYQHMIGPRIRNIQQCCQHVIRRARHVQGLGPGGAQNWAGDIITVLRDAHEAVEKARDRGSTALDPQVLDDLRERYDTAVKSGEIHNRLRDWDKGNHPGCALARWLRGYKEQVFLFTRDFDVDWVNNVSERGAKKAKRHQAVSGCWQSLATLQRWCRLASYLDSAAAHEPPHSTPSAPSSKQSPGYRHCLPSAECQVPAPREWTRFWLLCLRRTGGPPQVLSRVATGRSTNGASPQPVEAWAGGWR
jgi:hypothetical protein